LEHPKGRHKERDERPDARIIRREARASRPAHLLEKPNGQDLRTEEGHSTMKNAQFRESIIIDDKLYRKCDPCPAWSTWLAIKVSQIAERGIKDCHPPKLACLILRYVTIGFLPGIAIGATIATIIIKTL
jgi:hypothetical protein